MTKWIQRWAGAYTFISCSFWGPQYYHALEKELGMPLDPTLFIYKKGNVTFLMTQEKLDQLGKHLVSQVKKNPEIVDKRLQEVKINYDILCRLMKKLENTIPSSNQFEEYINYFNNHLPNHVFMKKTLEYMPEKMLKKYESRFKDARFYAEPIYTRTEKFFRALTLAISKKENIANNLLTCLTEDELVIYIKKSSLPDKSILKKRYDHSIIFSENGKLKILTGKEAKKFENSLFENKSNKVEGNPAFPGKVTGKVKILLNPYDKNNFQKGDILVTGMTNPDFIPLMKKASAIITDAGGLLCHAAIVAREMKKPTIIGTENATKILKDGDIIEVDAEKGKITII